MKKVTKTIRKCIPTPSLILFAVFILSALVYILSVNITAFADFINSTVSRALRFLLSSLTGFLPFSLFELLLILLVPALVIALIFGLTRRGLGRIRFIAVALSVISLLLSTYIFSFGIAYRASPISESLGLSEEEEISEEELTEVFILVRDEVNKCAEGLTAPSGASEMGYSMDELSEKISAAYLALSEDYPDVHTFSSRAKPVLASTVMSSMRITGIYSPFTGEANVNMEYPDYNLPFTVAHEFAHQRGIARENEANFIAHLVCAYSSDPYVRYSGYLSLYEYLASALYSLDAELYSELSAELSAVARTDILASRDVSAKYKGSTLGKINDKANDIYLKTNGTEGVVSYSFVVRLAVAYYTD
ncbi:MAG: DUF3810 domain-containing protein [Clostridia bacterium]|nr:DUF3810 domain-containing protein [Clostridia bacterium]